MNVNGNCTGQEFLENPHTLLLFSPYHTLLEQVLARGKMIFLLIFQKLKSDDHEETCCQYCCQHNSVDNLHLLLWSTFFEEIF